MFDGLAEYEAQFFCDLARSYARLDLELRGYFLQQLKRVVKETIAILRAGGGQGGPRTDPSGGAEN